MTSVAITHQPSRIRCLEMCLRHETCKAVNYGNYRGNPGDSKMGVLYGSVPEESQREQSRDWHLIVL